MRPIKFVYYGEGWSDEYEAILINEFTVVRFTGYPENDIAIYTFPYSLDNKDSVHYYGDTEFLPIFITFENVNFQPFDLTRPFIEIIADLAERQQKEQR